MLITDGRQNPVRQTEVLSGFYRVFGGVDVKKQAMPDLGIGMILEVDISPKPELSRSEVGPVTENSIYLWESM